MRALPHRLAAVWFADIVGYGRLSSRNENEALHLVQLFQRACRDVVRDRNGRIVKFMGDAALAEFSSTEAAVRAACALEAAFHREAQASELTPPRLHVGVHVGEIATAQDGDLYGEGLNLASRLQTLAGPGEVLTSEDVHRQLHHRPEFEFAALGERTIKDSDVPIRLYRVTARAGAEGAPDAVGGRGWRFRDAAARRRIPRVVVYALSAALLLIAAVAILLPSLRGPGSGAASLPHNRVAVLYFDDFSPDSGLRYMADGLTESLIQELSLVPGLEVVSRNGVKPFEDAAVFPDSVARALRAGTLVQGSVQEFGGRLRVTVQLIDGGSGDVVEARTLERTRDELFALQDDVAAQVGNFLRSRLGEEIRLAELRAGTASVLAWELVQRAQEMRQKAQPLVQTGSLVEAERQYARADSLLVAAQAADTSWAVPRLRRGWLAHERAEWTEDSDIQSSMRWNKTGLAFAADGAKRDPDDPDLLELRGTLRLWRAIFAPERDPGRAEEQFAEAARDLRAAVEANPSQAGAWSELSRVLAVQGEREQAKAAASHAYEADAYLTNIDEILWRLFQMSYDLDQPVEAERWCEEGARRFPDETAFVACRLWLMTMRGVDPEPERAYDLLASYDRLIPPQDEASRKTMRMAVATVLARAGLRDSALAVAVRARGDETIDPSRELMYYEAFTRTVADRDKEAVELVRAYLRASPAQRREVAVTWWFEPLHDRSDFKALVAEPGASPAP